VNPVRRFDAAIVIRTSGRTTNAKTAIFSQNDGEER